MLWGSQQAVLGVVMVRVGVHGVCVGVMCEHM